MTELFIVLAFILIAGLWLRGNILSRRVDALSERISKLEGGAAEARVPVHGASKRAEIPAAALPAEKEKVKPAPSPVKGPAAETAKPAALRQREKRQAMKKPAFLAAAERQLAENWTGILGAAILVMGVGFLGIYAALSFSALFRSVMVTGVAAALFGAWLVLRRFEAWTKLSHWMRSASGAVLVFAALGAGGIPGLKCIDNPWAALVLLMLCIALNLYFGYAGGTEYFASLHALISLAAVASAPQNSVTFIVAGVIVFTSILISFRERWEYHILVCIASFFAYHLYWFFSTSPADAASHSLRYAGIAMTLLVGGAAIASHYRQIYRSSRFETLPFAVHLLNWAFLGTGLLLYSTGSKWNSILLGAAAMSVFLLSRHARKLGIRWLRTSDLLIAQSLALYALLILSRWGLDPFTIAAIVCAETIIFYAVEAFEGEALPVRAGMALYHLSSAMFLFVGFWSSGADAGSPVRHASIAGVLFVLVLLFHLRLRAGKGEGFDSFSAYGQNVAVGAFSVGGVIVPFFPLYILWASGVHAWGILIFSLTAALLLMIRQRVQGSGMGIGLSAAIPAAFLICWVQLFSSHVPVGRMLLSSAPLAAVCFVCIAASSADALKRWVRWPGVYLLAVHLAVTAYLALRSERGFVFSAAVLALALVFFETARFMRVRKGAELTALGDTDRFLLHAAYGFVALFLVHHLLFDFKPHGHSIIRPRLFVELAALAVFIRWALAKRHASSPDFKSWVYLQPLFWELAVLFSLVPALRELPSVYLPAAWGIYAHLLLLSGRWMPRMRLYSSAFFLASLVHVSLMLGGALRPESGYVRSALAGGVTLALASVYALRHFSEGKTVGSVFPAALRFLEAAARVMDKGRNILIHYMLAAALIFAVYRIAGHLSPLAAGPVWLLFSLVYLEISLLLSRRFGARCEAEGRIDGCMLNCGFAFIAAFLVRHFTVHLQSEAHIGVLPVRLSIALFALAVIAYWALSCAPSHAKGCPAWKYGAALFWELFIVFASLTALAEVPEPYHAPVWILAAIALLAAGAAFPAVSRFRIYSLVFHWLTIFVVVFLLTGPGMPGDRWYADQRFVGAVAIVLQFVYIALFHAKGAPAQAVFPELLSRLSGAAALIGRRQNPIVYYPLFAGVALFIHAAADPSIRTLLWVGETFAVFVVSVILRENHFRYLSMGGLAVCLLRLVFHDLSSSGTVLKGVVFVGVGAIMLSMNMIYSRFRSRF